MKYTVSNIKNFIGPRALMILCCGLMSSFILSGFEYGTALFIQYFMASISLISAEKLPLFLQKYATTNVVISCGLLIFIGCGRAIFQCLSGQSNTVFSQTINTRLRLLAIYELLFIDFGKESTASRIHLRMGETFPKAGQFAHSCANMLTSSVQVFFLLASLLYTAPRETLFGIAGLSLVAVAVKLLQRKILGISRGVLVEQEKLARGIERITKNIFFIRVSKIEGVEYESMIDQALSHYNFLVRSGIFVQITSVLPSLFGIGFLSIIIYISQQHFHTEPTALVTFLYLFIRFLQQASAAVGDISGTTSLYPQFSDAFAYLTRFNQDQLDQAFECEKDLQMVRRKKQRFSFRPNQQQGGNGNETSPEINAKNLGFAWKAGGEDIFSDLDFSIPKNQALGIRGKSGVGKSTLLKLILGILPPTKGEIKISGMAPGRFIDDNYQRIGFVGAEPFLIGGSVRENLEYGQAEKHTDEDIIEVMKFVGLDELLAKADSLDLFISENGDGLSTGQKQRLSFARALLRKPSLLILDEATANLDTVNEQKICEFLMEYKKNCTLVIVSHREALLKVADHELTLGARLQ